jgi:arylsulfatase A-like enzyme
MSRLYTSLIIILLITQLTTCVQQEIHTKPNVLFIICDQLNAAALSSYNGPVNTPNIDRLGSEGVLFTDATCVLPFCSPTRASLITGRYPHSVGITYNVNISSDEGIHAGDITTEKLLYEAGYNTYHFGKWHLGSLDLSYYTGGYFTKEYAAEMKDKLDSVRLTDPATWMAFYTDMAIPVEINPEHKKAVDRLGNKWSDKIYAEFITDMGRQTQPVEEHLDVRIADETIAKILSMKNASKPFMITCSFNNPHDPNVIPSPYYEMFDPDEIKLPANIHTRELRFENSWSREIVSELGEPSLREFLRIYYGQVKIIDDQVGRILKALEETGMLDNTLIIFTADHGDMMGGHGMVWKSNGSFYEEIVRVPLLMRYPPLLNPQVSSLNTNSTDIMPTILEAVHLDIPEKAQGLSLLPYITEKKGKTDFRPYNICERISKNSHSRSQIPEQNGSFMVRNNVWKYVLYPDGDEYLYNLQNDPGEVRNLANNLEMGSQKKEMQRYLIGWLDETGWQGMPLEFDN